jgi:hypothetical protein
VCRTKSEFARHHQALAGGSSTSQRHHRALGGGPSTSQLNTTPPRNATPPGFSRWYFNFTTPIASPLLKEALLCSYEVEVPPAKAWWCPEAKREAAFVAVKLKDQRLKPGGVYLSLFRRQDSAMLL